MLDKRTLSNIFLSIILLAACQPQTPTVEPTHQTWQIVRDTNLAWMGNVMRDCLASSPAITLSLQETPLSRVVDISSDINLVWGNPQDVYEYKYTLGFDEWVMIVHPDNSIDSLTTSQVRSILAGKTRTWNKLIPELKEKDEVTLELWVYPPADEAQAWLRSALGNSSTLPANARLAPGAQAMFEAVSSSENSFGFIPSRWAAPSVKIVPISDLDEGALRQPIVATLPTSTADQQAWLACLQTSLTASPEH
jgi:hypothetical protein